MLGIIVVKTVNLFLQLKEKLGENGLYCKTIGCCNGVSRPRWNMGFRACMQCAETIARKRKFTIVPMHKSNYIPIFQQSLLNGINSKSNKYE